MVNQFTDNLLASLYLNLEQRYKLLKTQHLPALSQAQIYQQLVNQLSCEISHPQSAFYNASLGEQHKIFTILNTFFNANTHSNETPEPIKLIFHCNKIPIYDTRLNGHQCLCPADATFHWSCLNSILKFNSLCEGQSLNERKENEFNRLLEFLVLLTTCIIGIVFVSAYYLLLESLNSLERFNFNEGYLQAAISFASILAAGSVTAFLTSTFAWGPLGILALSLGFANPIGFMVVGIGCLTLIGSAVGCFLSNQIHDYISTKINKNALDPADPNRYQLTKEEETALLCKGLDPTKVKCAIVALHEQIGGNLSPFLHRFFSATMSKQNLLETIRNLRQGRTNPILEIGKGVNKQIFDLRPFPPELPLDLPEAPVGYGIFPIYSHEMRPFPSPLLIYPIPSAPPN